MTTKGESRCSSTCAQENDGYRQDSKADVLIDHRREHHARGQYGRREVHLFDELGVLSNRPGGPLTAFGQAEPTDHAAEQKQRVVHGAATLRELHAHEYMEDKGVGDQLNNGVDHRPEKTNGAAHVAVAQVIDREGSQKPSVGPELLSSAKTGSAPRASSEPVGVRAD